MAKKKTAKPESTKLHPASGFYRKQSIRKYSDRKYRALSGPQPNAKTLFDYLILGPHTGPVPGLFRVSLAELAFAHGWSEHDTDEKMAELEAHGMAKFDRKEGVAWLPNGLRHNEPDNRDVVKGWIPYLELVPQCDLKTEALLILRCVSYLEKTRPPCT